MRPAGKARGAFFVPFYGVLLRPSLRNARRRNNIKMVVFSSIFYSLAAYCRVCAFYKIARMCYNV